MEWVSENSSARTNVIALHGLGSYAESFNGFGQFMNKKGVNVFAIELRGFGHWKYNHRWGYTKFDDITEDLHILLSNTIRPAYPGFRYFILGDSLGCIHTINSIDRYRGDWEGVIFVSPFFLNRYLRVLQFFLYMLRIIAPAARIRILRNMFQITHDLAFIEYDKKLGIGAQWFSAELLFEVASSSAKTRKRLKQEALEYPIFIASGDRDVLLHPSNMIRSFPRILAKRKEYKIYKGGHHLLLNDEVSQIVFQDILSFLNPIVVER